MSLVLTSNDVAVWLRFQIAAGRLTEPSDTQAMIALAHQLGVNISTVSAAYEQLGAASIEAGGTPGITRFCDRFGVVADLVDQLIALESSEVGNTSDF